MLYKKRPYDEKPAESSGAGSGGGPISKVGRSGQARSYSVNQVAPKGKVATLTRVGAGGHRTVLSWQDAPDDVLYRASPQTKKVARFDLYGKRLRVTGTGLPARVAGSGFRCKNLNFNLI